MIRPLNLTNYNPRSNPCSLHLLCSLIGPLRCPLRSLIGPLHLTGTPLGSRTLASPGRPVASRTAPSAPDRTLSCEASKTIVSGIIVDPMGTIELALKDGRVLPLSSMQKPNEKLPVVYSRLNHLNPQSFSLGLHLDFRHLNHLGLSLLGYNHALGAIVMSTLNRHVPNSNAQRCQAEFLSTMQIVINIGLWQLNFPK